MHFPANVSDDQRAIQALLVISEIEIIIEKRGQVLVSFRRLRKLYNSTHFPGDFRQAGSKIKQ